MNVSFTRALIVLSVAALGPSGILGEVAAARAARSHRGLCTSATHTQVTLAMW